MNLVLLELSLRGWSVTTNAKAQADGSLEVFVSCGNRTRVLSARTSIQPNPANLEAAIDELAAQLWQLCVDGAPLPAVKMAQGCHVC